LENGHELQQLFKKFLDRKCSPVEIRRLSAYFDVPENETALKAAILNYFEKEESTSASANEDRALAEIHRSLMAEINRDDKFRIRPRYKIALAAASVVLAVSFGGYFLLHKKQKEQQIAQNQRQDILPGGNKAILTLANGHKISLTDAKNGNIAQQSGTQITKSQNGQVVYIVNKNAALGTASTGSGIAEAAYNTIETPRGGQTVVTLADGTIAYLDAASSIKFPVVFNGKERRVLITGQVYFEVVHNSRQPFMVSVNNETIEDIGTDFNINAYADETDIRTTLVEGKVKVSDPKTTVYLVPGEQAVNYAAGLKVKAADVEHIMAWKNGLFSFRDADIKTVMREISRWYDVDVSYEGYITKQRMFNGEFHRNVNASKVLEILSFYKIHYQIQGKKILITQE
jgi:transmembrane sensor